ncbi:MAG: hypothetical protein OYL41_02865 [Acidobacteriota bacterium]|nr:hypothetical protein [Acidobacteriota bacterium]
MTYCRHCRLDDRIPVHLLLLGLILALVALLALSDTYARAIAHDCGTVPEDAGRTNWPLAFEVVPSTDAPRMHDAYGLSPRAVRP